jgi:hypothetical protein
MGGKAFYPDHLVIFGNRCIALPASRQFLGRLTGVDIFVGYLGIMPFVCADQRTVGSAQGQSLFPLFAARWPT